ncbi:ATP-binding protein [Phenylobacterium sp.]|uniref:ATP-binding protein n=1 Tax=Phenylobacterium sp. TaxID=1871053 RepID=UPI00272F8A09|nr:ATP-binding protein [Phenylobacterium sp.]MDP1598441.1 ATP-binding protein [Phenylobacterium sp.]MDP3591374.1 ATP-binding protein [Phenylobacterium sp.]
MTQIHTEVIAAQRQYALRALSQSLGLVVPEAFVRGIRHLGYRTNVEAIAELVDNSIQAYAETVDIVFGYDADESTRKPTHLAIVDDGHGMDPDMLRFAMMWGGTHRENDRHGLGRFGYGLPCATVSMGRRFTIYSKTRGAPLYAVTLDLDSIDAGNADAEHEVTIPAAERAELPHFLHDAIGRAYPGGWQSGTVIVIDKLDRLDWTTSAGLRRNLVRQFGVAYHKLLRATRVHVDGEQVRPIDPLFLDPDADLHDLDEDRAIALDPVIVRIEGDEGRVGEVMLRYAWLPPSFAATDKTRDAIGINANTRFPIIKQYHGINFSRNGRLVDVQSRTPWTIFINNDRYIRIEIEFSATLDEAFGVTTSKQQVSVSPEMWDRLRGAGLHKAIEHLRAKVRSAKAERPTRELQAITFLAPTAAPRGVAAADALRVLLDEIERRASIATPALRTEYRELLSGWSKRLAGNTAGSPQYDSGRSNTRWRETTGIGIAGARPRSGGGVDE